MMSPLFERVREIAADILQVPAEQVTPSSSPETIPTWDSVQHLNLVLALEQEFDLQFEPEEIDKMKNIEQILDVLDSKIEAPR